MKRKSRVIKFALAITSITMMALMTAKMPKKAESLFENPPTKKPVDDYITTSIEIPAEPDKIPDEEPNIELLNNEEPDVDAKESETAKVASEVTTKSTITAGVENDDLEVLPRDNELEMLYVVNLSYTTPPEEAEAEEAYSYEESISVVFEELDGDDEIGPPIAPPDNEIEESFIIPESDSEPLAEEAEPPIDDSLKRASDEIS